MKRRLITTLIFAILVGFPAYALAGSATLHWEPNSDPDLAAYRIYYGTASRSYGPYVPVQRNMTSYVVNGLDEGRTYFFALTAVDTAGNESGYSAEVSKSIGATQALPGGTTGGSAGSYYPIVNPSGSQRGHSAETAGASGNVGSRASSGNIHGKVSGPDFDGDGSADIVFRNHRTGDTQILLVKGENYDTESFSLPRVSDKNWKMNGTGDFNKDGSVDIVWRNYRTGENGIWLMKGTQHEMDTVSLPRVSNTDWHIEGTGDFNKDGSVDIVWRNYRTGDNGIWLMNGTTSEMNKVSLPRFSNTDWHIEGTGDFNKDGNVDILWRNYRTGDNMIWPMNGTRYEMSTPVLSLQRVSDVDWHIEGVGDYNKDGNVDIVWQNHRTGARGIWLMNGTKFTLGNNVWLKKPPT